MSNEAIAVQQEEAIELVESQSIMTNEQAVTLLNLTNKLKTAAPLVKTNRKYFTFKEKQKVRGVFKGFTTGTFKNKLTGVLETQEAIEWMGFDESGKPALFLSAGVALVNEFKGAGIQPTTMVEIESTGKAKDGKTNIFDVTILGELAK